jgi:hypothetical protein
MELFGGAMVSFEGPDELLRIGKKFIKSATKRA